MSTTKPEEKSGAASAPMPGSPSRPHINIPRESSSWNGRCVHYAGMMETGMSLKRKTHCNAGVEYASVEKKVDYTYSRRGERPYEAHTAHPCFKHEHPLTDGCAKCRFPTPEEIKAHDEEATGLIKRITIAHKAIVADLERRHKAGDAKVQMNVTRHADFDDGYDDGPRNYISGGGVMDCPVCKTGKLHYSRASCNGHVHARCSTADCVAWMQ